MLILKNTSIKSKIIASILLVSALCIVVALTVFIYINYKDEQRTAVNNISVLGKLIGNRSQVALTFNDKHLARDNLQSLQSHPAIILACLYDVKGALFVDYIKLKNQHHACQPELSIHDIFSQYSIENGHLLVTDAIIVDGEKRGIVSIKASLESVDKNLSRYLLIAILTGIAITILAFVFASKLQGIILKPLLELTNAAKKISEKKDYSVRAEKFGQDEIGRLVDSFNSMLSTISEQNQTLIETTEKANAANAIKSQFLANMSHELRTPINGVLGMNDLLMATELSEEQKEYTMLAAQCSGVLLDTVNQILDLASIESVGLTLKPQEVNMGTFVDDITQLFSAQLANEKLDLSVYVSDNMPEILKFDPVRMRQVFINLIANAIKFTQQGGVRVDIDFANERLQVEVEDTGIGIPEDARQRVFESFQQVDNSSTRPFGGTGLGLSISLEICLAMDGEISIKSSSHGGSIFAFDVAIESVGTEVIQPIDCQFQGKIIIFAKSSALGNWISHTFDSYQINNQVCKTIAEMKTNIVATKMLIVDAQCGLSGFEQAYDFVQSIDSSIQLIWYTWVGNELPARYDGQVRTLYKPATHKSLFEIFEPEKKVENSQNNAQGSIRILIAEDNVVNMKAIKSQLENAGYIVDSAENGQQAIHACRSHEYQLVLMDIQMPKVDGLQACTQIRKEHGYSAPPIIGISAHVMQEHIDAAFDAGMQGYLCKPIKEKDLLAKVNEMLLKT